MLPCEGASADLCNGRIFQLKVNRMYRAGRLSTTRLAITVVLAVLLLGFTTRQAALLDDRAASGGWDREGAARYLDER
ncbi:MAG: hypothetical protein DMF60_01940, partial [Acidobacteria bacterium]